MKNEFFEDLQVIMVDRINAAELKDSDYKNALQAESTAYENLMLQLDEPQKKLFEDFYVLSGETTAICEKISYRQGIEDLSAMLFNETT